MLVSYKLGDRIFDKGKIYIVDNDTACFLSRKRAAVVFNDKKFFNKMLKIDYEAKNYDC